MPGASRLVRSCAAAAGPTISVKTLSTPTICTDRATPSATTAMNGVATSRSRATYSTAMISKNVGSGSVKPFSLVDTT